MLEVSSFNQPLNPEPNSTKERTLMSNSDANREMKAKVAETLLSAEEARKILKDDDGAKIHYQLLRWLIP